MREALQLTLMPTNPNEEVIIILTDVERAIYKAEENGTFVIKFTRNNEQTFELTMTGLKTTIEGQTNTINALKNTVDNLPTNLPDNSSIVKNDSDKLSLNAKWQEYLTKATFEVPTLTLSTTSVLSHEYGSIVTAPTFKHKETNIDNISGTNVQLFKNDVSYKTTAKSTTESTILTSDNLTMTQNYVFQLKCTDTLGETRVSNKITFSYYYPSYIQASASTPTNVTSATKINGSIKGTRTVTTTSGQYVFFISHDTINKITSGGFEVPITQLDNITVTLGSQSVAYKMYRTTNALVAGDNTFLIE